MRPARPNAGPTPKPKFPSQNNSMISNSNGTVKDGGQVAGAQSPLDAALEYLERGITVVPQLPRGKRPCIKWKLWQDKLPTERQLRLWWEAFPTAGVAAICGPTSNLFVIDVDGPEAHEALIAKLGERPRAPTAISGSGKPHRYHLFFRHPDITTKAKATPWHPSLEFRGYRGVVILPPSMHKSKNRYRWEDGLSMDDLDPPDVSRLVLDALRPQPRPAAAVAPRTPSAGQVGGRAERRASAWLAKRPGPDPDPDAPEDASARVFAAAVKMVRVGLDDFAALRLLRDWADTGSRGPGFYPDSELQRKLSDARASNSPDPDEGPQPFAQAPRSAEGNGVHPPEEPAEDPPEVPGDDGPSRRLPALLELADEDAEDALAAALLPVNLEALVAAKDDAPAELERLYRALERQGIAVRRVERLKQTVNAEAKAEKKRRQEQRRQDRTRPADQTVTAAGVTNYREEPFENDAGEIGMIRVGLPGPNIAVDMLRVTAGWPKAASGLLFVPNPEGSPAWLGEPAKLFGWLQTALPPGERNGVLWAEGHDKVSRADYHAALPSLVERYDAVEPFPHFPPIAGHYYMHPDLPPSDGSALRALVERFSPATPLDYDLIEAFFLSLFWGGPYGQRPAWLFTATEDDDKAGRGIGKSTVPEMAALLVQGSLAVDQDEKMSDVVKRLLSDEGMTSRLVLLDNLKTLKFSWGQLEALITQRVISGHRMYQGEGRRPNTLTVALTLNGASLSKDMAQRCVIVHLKRPDYGPSWKEETQELIEARRWEIVADCIGRLRNAGQVLQGGGRWSAWEQGVLSRIAEPSDCQKTILERQDDVDEDTSEAAIVREWFASELERRRHSPDSARVFIPSRDAAEWVNEATGERRSVSKACSYLAQLNLGEIRKSASNGNRGFAWTGSKAQTGAKSVALGHAPGPF